MKTYLVTLRVVARQKVEVVADSEDIAAEIATGTYSLLGAEVLSDEVVEVENVTEFRSHA